MTCENTKRIRTSGNNWKDGSVPQLTYHNVTTLPNYFGLDEAVAILIQSSTSILLAFS